MLVNIILFTVILLLFFAALIKRGLFFLHMFQLESYKSKQFIKWYNDNENRILSKTFSINLLLIFVLILFYFIITRYFDKFFVSFILKKDLYFKIIKYSIIIYFSIFLFYLIFQKRKKQKKPFVFTPRAKRLFTTFLIFSILLLLTFFYLTNYKLKHCFLINYCSFKISFFDLNNFPLFTIFYLILIYSIPYILFLSNYIISPVEKRIQKKFYKIAKNKINQMKDLTIIGITGSFGKTSTKFITGNILKYFFKDKILITPESYNTTMGVCKVINNQLNDNHKVFVVEMGARQRGDIKEIAELVSPQFGIITSIGEAHLETFKTIKNTVKTKFELIDSLNNPAISILNGDNKYILGYVNDNIDGKYSKIKDNIVFYGIEKNELDKSHEKHIFAKNIKVTNEGVEFDIYYKKEKFKNVFEKLQYVDNQKSLIKTYLNKFINKNETSKNDKYGYIKAKSKLLGKFNVYNILAAVSIALSYGISPEEIKKAINSLNPVKHRLELIDLKTGVLIIDDAFNSNPAGAKMALDVLASFEGKRKVIVTPGIIELGEKEVEINKEFGRQIATICDIVILVENKVSKFIYDGVIESGFSENNIYNVKGLSEAQLLLRKILKINDVVLFENDLPDNLEY